VTTQYHRPLTLDDAVALAARPTAVVLGGGTSVVPTLGSGSWEVVDLQALDLAGVSRDGEVMTVGAMTTLQDLIDTAGIERIIADAADLEAPSTLRGVGTIGGVVGDADRESPLLTTLMAMGAQVEMATMEGHGSVPIDDLVWAGASPEGAIITAISFPADGVGAAEWTARTPKDRPIVMAVAHRARGAQVRLALAGVADRPVVVEPGMLDELDPPSDFRGSSAYRRHLAGVLSDRVLARIGGPS
jgi:CO/xanthine dehydrogenase FAD-binding subunit